MLGFHKVLIAPWQRGVMFRDAQPIAVFGAGLARWFDWSGRNTLQLEAITGPEVQLPNIDTYLRAYPDVFAAHMELVEIGVSEVGLVYKDGKLASLLAPSTRVVYWRNSTPVRVERCDISKLELPNALLKQAQQPQTPELTRQLNLFALIREVPEQHVGLLFVDGVFQHTLKPGTYGFWKIQRSLSVDVVDLRQISVEVNGQEILTRDKLSLRANLGASWRVVDAVLARTRVVDFKDALYRELQFGLRQAIGTRTLDALLANKGELDAAVYEFAQPKLAAFGVELIAVGIKDLILPGEMKEILNQVVQAEKAALANVIRRREETAATRSLLNTAKLIEESPVLMRLKELESLEKVTEKIDKLTVFGGLNGLMNELVKLR